MLSACATILSVQAFVTSGLATWPMYAALRSAGVPLARQASRAWSALVQRFPIAWPAQEWERAELEDVQVRLAARLAADLLASSFHACAS